MTTRHSRPIPSRSTRWSVQRARFAVVGLGTIAAGSGFPAAAQARVPTCSGVGAPRVLVSGSGTYESSLFDRGGRLLYTGLNTSTLRAFDAPGAASKIVARVRDPGGIVERPDGELVVGSGNAATGLFAPQYGFATLSRVDPATGAVRRYAAGLSMSNGVALAPDGTIFASDDLAASLDKVDPDGTVHRGWLRPASSNGLAVSADGRTLYVSQFATSTSILAVDTQTGAIRHYFARGGADAFAGFDGISIDSSGRLYAAAYLMGEIWRIDSGGRTVCALARGLKTPSSTAVGRAGAGFAPTDLAVTTHGGQVLVIPNAVPAA